MTNKSRPDSYPINKEALALGWIDADRNPPELYKWVSVLIDHNVGDYIHKMLRKGEPRYEVIPAYILYMDDGLPSWRKGMGITRSTGVEYVTHYKPLPDAPNISELVNY